MKTKEKFYTQIRFCKVSNQYLVRLFDHHGKNREACYFNSYQDGLNYMKQIKEAYNVKNG